MFDFEEGRATGLHPIPRSGVGSVRFVVKADVPTVFGRFAVHGFQEATTGKEHLAVVAGPIDGGARIDVRIHSECLTGEVLGSLKCDCRPQLVTALRHIGERGGVLLYLRQEGRGIGLLNKLKAYVLQEQGHDTVEANHLLGFADDMRGYAPAVDMLRFLGISKVRLLTNNPLKVGALEGAGFDVVREAHQQASNPHNLRYLMTKAEKSGHLLRFPSERCEPECPPRGEEADLPPSPPAWNPLPFEASTLEPRFRHRPLQRVGSCGQQPDPRAHVPSRRK